MSYAAWLIKMAWRDCRKNRSRLLLFVSAIILGIAALVAIGAFGENLKKEIDHQAATLIGADLEISSRKQLIASSQNLIDSLKSLSLDSAHERQFASMVLFVKNGGSRLVQVRALQGNYPFYGALETRPEQAAGYLTTGKQCVLVDQALLYQFNAEIGDSVQLGTKRFCIAGALTNSPGQTIVAGTVAPTVFMPLKELEETGLTEKGSRINDHYYFLLKASVSADELTEKLEERLDQLDLRASTITSTKENTGRSFADLQAFLGLVGFIALLLGCLGVASTVQIYIKDKLISVAVLRCLGATNRQTFLIYLMQITGIGLLGGIIGAGLGTVVQQLLPWALKDFLPLEVGHMLSWKAILIGIFTGLIMAVLFTLVPLLQVRRVSPLHVLRIQDDRDGKSIFRDPITGLVILGILVFIIGFSRIQLQDWYKALWFCTGLVVAFAVLYGTAWLLMFFLKRYVPTSWPYAWRQGLANLYRPHNQTIVLMIAIGLGTAFIASIFFIQDMLLDSVRLSSSANQPNMILFDIQSRQKEEVVRLTRSMHLPVLQEVPVITMQLTHINGFSANDVRQDSSIKIPLRGFGDEIRATYRDSLLSSEKLTKGVWLGRVKGGDTARISLDERYADRIGVHIGDLLNFNVQGLSVPARIASFRDVDWNRMQTNFRVVFPLGVIDDAPQFYVVMTKSPDDYHAARFQQAIVSHFPNVSIIDLKLILSVLDSLLNKISFVIRFIGAFSILTALVVLITAVRISKYQRIKEYVLLRTVGASKRQLLSITACEYCLLGVLAACTGIILALLASCLLALFVFEAPFIPKGYAVLALFLSVPALTLIIGLLNNLSTLKESPLRVLRREN